MSSTEPTGELAAPETGIGANWPFMIGGDQYPASEWLARAEADVRHYAAKLATQPSHFLGRHAGAVQRVNLWERIVFSPHPDRAAAVHLAVRAAVKRVGGVEPTAIATVLAEVERGARSGARQWLQDMRTGDNLAGVLDPAAIEILGWL